MKDHFNLMLLAFFPIALIWILYYPTLSLGFAKMDDSWMLLDDPMVGKLTISPSYFVKLLCTFNSLQYSPVNTLFYKLIFLINRFDPYYYHLANVIYHSVNTCLCYVFIRQITTLYNVIHPRLIAYLSSVLWSVHPFNVESVVWISASKVLLFSTFAFFSLILVIRFVYTKQPAYYIFSVISFVLCCMTKEQGVMISLVVIAIYFPIRNNFTEWAKFRWIYYCCPYLFAGLAFGLIGIYAQMLAIGFETPASSYDFSDRFIFVFYCLGFYLSGMFVPIELHYHYPYPMKAGESLPFLYYFIPILLILCLLAYIPWIKRRLSGSIKFWLLFFVINLLLCIHIFPLRRPSIMADRYMYLPAMAVIVISVELFLKSLMGNNSPPSKPYWLMIAFLIYFFCIAFTSQNLVNDWKQYNI